MLHLRLHERQLLGWNLWFLLTEQLALAVKQLDLLLVVFARHGEEDGVLKAERTLGDEALLLLVLLFYHWRLRPDLVDGLRILWESTLHGPKNHIMLFLGLIRA